MTDRTTWRWMFWSTSIFQVVMMGYSFITFRETYAPLLLKRRAKSLRQATGQAYQTLEERLIGDRSVLYIVTRALTRPLRLLAMHPIIQVVSLISAFHYGLLYICLSTFAELWLQRYGQSREMSGLHYIACTLGEVLGSQIGAGLMDRLFYRTQRRPGGNNHNHNHEHQQQNHSPEDRIPLAIPGAVIAPLGLVLYGWAAQYRLHWAAVDAGMVVATFGMQVGSMALHAYVMDAYPEHTSSALAASQFVKSLTAFLFPLFAPAMYAGLGYGWGNSVLTLAGLVIGVPAPLVIWFFGARLRARAESSF